MDHLATISRMHKCPGGLGKGQEVQLGDAREVSRIAGHAQSQNLTGARNVERAKEAVPNGEDEAVVSTPVFRVEAVVNLMLRRADEDAAHDRPVRQPDMRMAKLKGEQVKGEDHDVDPEERDDGDVASAEGGINRRAQRAECGAD